MSISVNLSSVSSWMTESIVPWLLSHGLTIALIIVGALVVKKIALNFIDRVVRRAVPGSSFSNSDAERKREDTLISLFRGALSIVIWIIAVLMILGELMVEIGPLLAGAGIAGVAFGFGAQYLVRDLINGFFIVFENQYRVGDAVCFGDTCGTVEVITLRTTILRDLDGVVHHIPNGEIKITSNMSKDFSRINLDIGVSYDAELETVIEIVNRIGNELAEDPDWKDKIKEAPQFLRVNDLADSAVIIKILGETKPLEQWSVMGELRRRIKIAFDKAGIEIPFPQQVVRYVNKPQQSGE